MTRMAILITDGAVVRQESLEQALRPGGFRVEGALTAAKTRAILEGFGEQQDEVGFFVDWDGLQEPSILTPLTTQSPSSTQSTTVRSLLIEMLMHQLTNILKSQESITSTLKDVLKKPGDDADELLTDLITSMHEASKGHAMLLQAMSDATSSEYQGPCKLLDAAQHAEKLFAPDLTSSKISLDIQIGQDIHLDIPLHVIILVLCNLVGNAKDAAGQGGIIRIEAEDVGDSVACHVTDNGTGVAPDMIERIWEFGATTKGDRSKGRGLPLTKRALDQSGASIQLTKPGPGETTFTIYFPKLKKEY